MDRSAQQFHTSDLDYRKTFSSFEIPTSPVPGQTAPGSVITPTTLMQRTVTDSVATQPNTPPVTAGQGRDAFAVLEKDINTQLAHTVEVMGTYIEQMRADAGGGL